MDDRGRSPSQAPEKPLDGESTAASILSRAWLPVLFGAWLAAVLLTWQDYGASWDEGVQAVYGDLVSDYFESGGENRQFEKLQNLRYYGGSFELLCSLLTRDRPELRYEIRHLVTALTGLLTLFAVFWFGRLLGGGRVALFACVALFMLPRFYGHTFINSKDIPFACFFAWSMVLMTRLFLPGGRSLGIALLTGAFIGLTLSIRVGGMLLFALFAALLVHHLLTRRQGSQRRVGWLPLLLVPVLAWILMVLFWPYAHDNVLLNPLRAFREAAKFAFAYPILFEGRVVMSDELPGRYLSQFLLLTTPLATLTLAAVGLLFTGLELLRGPRRPTAIARSSLLLWFLFPLVYAVIKRPNIYDGLRHFLFILPALTLLCGVGADRLLGLLRSTPARWLAGALALILLLLPARDLWTLHPYQMTWFNRLAGGMEKASLEYETDYWCTSYKEAMEWVNRRAEESGENGVRVLVAANRESAHCAGHFKSKAIRMQFGINLSSRGGLPEGVRYFVSTTRQGYHLNYPDAGIVHSVGRDGAIFAVVKEAR